MAFKAVTDLSTDTTISLGGFNKKTGKNNPTSVEGYFLGARKVESKKAKTGFAFIYTLQTSKGNVGVWGKTDLDRKMESVQPGQMVRASFDKMVPTPNGDMYKFKVEVDSENSIEVSATPKPNAYKAETSSSEDYNSDEEGQQTDNYEEEEVEQQAALAAAERKAKVAALLKGNKGSTNNK